MHQIKLTMKEYLIGTACILALIIGIAITPLHVNADMVGAGMITSISVDQTKTTLQYPVGSTILPSEVYIKVNGSSQSAHYNNLFIGSMGNTEVGSRTVTISFEGQTATYQVAVVSSPPTVDALEKLDYDTIGAYSAVLPGVSGINFVATRQGSTQMYDMGASANKSADGQYYYNTVKMLDPGYTYLIKARSYVEVNGEKFYSDWSSEKSIALPALTGVDKWRTEIKRQLLAHGVYSREYEDIIINIIRHESKGNERAGEGRYYVGLLQFKETWSHSYSQEYFTANSIDNFQVDNRLSGSWSIHEIADLIQHKGIKAVKQHWAGTWNL